MDDTNPNPQMGGYSQSQSPQQQQAKAEPVIFRPPPNFRAPESHGGVNPGWDLVCTFEALPDGRLQMTKLGDLELPKQTQPQQERKPSWEGFAGDTASAMQPTTEGTSM